MMNSTFLKQIQNNWTLFLDRDGVINQRLHGDYVKSISEFRFLKDVPEAVAILNRFFERIIVVTNQQGVGKGLMTNSQLDIINEYMRLKIQEAGGHIDKIYSCTDLSTDPMNCRKPKTTMAEWAKHDFPEIDFSRSVMIGDTETDLLFGQNCGMYTVLIDPEIRNISADAIFASLIEFAITVQKNAN